MHLHITQTKRVKVNFALYYVQNWSFIHYFPDSCGYKIGLILFEVYSKYSTLSFLIHPLHSLSQTLVVWDVFERRFCTRDSAPAHAHARELRDLGIVLLERWYSVPERML